MPLSELPPRFSACFGPAPGSPPFLPRDAAGTAWARGAGPPGGRKGVRGNRRHSFCSRARANHMATSGGRGVVRGTWGPLATCHLTLSPGKEEQGARK